VRSGAFRCVQVRSGAFRCDQVRSGAFRCDQVRSGACERKIESVVLMLCGPYVNGHGVEWCWLQVALC
jgi:hypothetical protein